MDKIVQIQACISMAEKGLSRLKEDVLQIGGYTSTKIRHLLNNLGMVSNTYFEIGSHRGSTFCAATYQNINLQKAIACDNFSEFSESAPHDEFLRNAEQFCSPSWYLIAKDCFEISYLPQGIDLYLYDGSHAQWAQKKALTYFHKFLPDEFIFLVDDYQWEDVRKGTEEGIKECGLEILFARELGMDTPSNPAEYWNGFGVFLLKKKA